MYMYIYSTYVQITKKIKNNGSVFVKLINVHRDKKWFQFSLINISCNIQSLFSLKSTFSKTGLGMSLIKAEYLFLSSVLFYDLSFKMCRGLPCVVFILERNKYENTKT